LYDLSLSTFTDLLTSGSARPAPIRPFSRSSETDRSQGITGSRAGVEIVKHFKVALEELMALEISFVCREDEEGEIELIEGELEQGSESAELARACLALCLYVVSLSLGRYPLIA
jgi:hypothetical protein